MKKEYKKPEVEIYEIEVEDIITASSGFSKEGLDLNKPDHEWNWQSDGE